MLCQFSVKNFYCIKEEITIDMQSTCISENENSLIIDRDGEKFLPISVIYGPNGCGKSTVLFALYSLVCKVMRPVCAVACNNEECMKKNSSLPIKPFKFSEKTINEPTEYELFFRTEKYEYHYYLSLLNNEVVEEGLDRKLIEGKRYSSLFTREKKNKITLKNSFKTYDCKEISSDLPLLSYLAITHKRNTIIKDIVYWFERKFDFVDYGDPYADSRVSITVSEDMKKIILQMLEEMDVDISDYRIEKEKNSENEKSRMKVFTTHSVSNKNYEIELLDESSGTIKIFGLLPYIADALLSGSVLIIDELDAKLHPLLLEYILKLFTNPKSNKKGAQLLYTSHDISTMNSQNFRRDEIWFVAKGDDLSSSIYSLVEFKNPNGKSERKDASYSKRYLEGKYGADPYLKRIINWENL